MAKILSNLLIILALSLPLAAQASNRVEIILDVSGSMGAMAGGEKKIEAAKKAVGNTVGSVPESAQVALRLYGHRVPNSKKDESCKDTQLVIPFGPVNVAQFRQALEQAMPLGQTPIAYSLEQAAQDFGPSQDEEAVIILVSDGKETCGGDPVATAKALLEKGFKVKINTIGFDVDADTRAQLEGISRATGGQYLDAKDTAQLSESLKDLTQKSLVIEKEKSVYGEPIRGGDAYETAVAIEPNKLWHLDHHQKKNEFDYFYIDLKEGQKLVATIKTGEKGVSIGPDNQAKENTNPYAGIQIHSPNKEKLKNKDIIGRTNDSFDLEYTVGGGQGGRYYVLVGSVYNNQHMNNPFQISLEEKYDAGSKQDAGALDAGALPITPGEYSGYIGPGDRTDVYKFSGKKGQNIQFKARDKIGKIKFRVILVDSDGVKLLTTDSPNEGAAVKVENFNLPQDGEYFIRLSSFYSSPPEAGYDMELTVSDSGTSAEPAPSKETPAPEKSAASDDAPVKTSGDEKALSRVAPGTGTKVQSCDMLCQLVGELPFMEKVKFYAWYSGIPLGAGILIGLIYGYVRGRKSGRRKAEKQAAQQASPPPPPQP